MIGEQLVERYRIVEQLDRGELSEVYLAEDPVLGRRVTIKIFHLAATSAGGLGEKAFLHRAQCIAQLEHPAIVPIFDFGQQDGALFVVMPVLGGVPLDRELDEGRVSLEELCEISARVAEVLEYCHGRRVPHGDVQAENILLRHDTSGLRVWLKDFSVLGGGAGLNGSDFQDLQKLLRQAMPTVERERSSLAEVALREAEGLVNCGLVHCGREFATVLRQLSQRLRINSPFAGGDKTEQPAEASLLGRAPEMARLLRHLQGTLRGECRLALVGGGPGSGKSRLLSEFASRARNRQFRVLSGNFNAGEGASPYHGFGEIVLDAVRQMRSGRWEGEPLRLDDLGPQLVRLVPTLRDLPELAGQTAPPSNPSGETQQTFELLASTLLRLAGQRPTLFLLEELHGSEVSAMALAYLINRLGSTPTLLVASYVPLQLPSHHRLLHLLREARSDPRCCVVKLGPLSEADHAELVASLLNVPVPLEQARQLYELSGGNPLFTHELIRSLDAQGRKTLLNASSPHDLLRLFTPWPRAVLRAVERGLEPLPSLSRRILQAASTLGNRFGPRDLEAMVTDGEAAEESVELLCRAGLLKTGTRNLLSFSSNLLRQVISSGLSPDDRDRLRHQVREMQDARAVGRRDRLLRLRAKLQGGESSAKGV